MAALSPQQAAGIAKHVYAVRQESDIQTAFELTGGLGIRDIFGVDGSSRFAGSSGPLIFRKQSGFGYVARGVGERQGEALVAVRGTATAKDWWTDANFGFQRGPSNWLVHAGFNDTFNSFVGDLTKYFRRSNPTHVHCVGHSLGGALATLTADYLSENRISGVSLYTFGGPRVGAVGFSKHFTKRAGEGNIHRVYHNADPVSMIPIFPYLHVPDPGAGIHLNWTGGRISVSAHFMESYIGSLGDAGWEGLRRASPEVHWSQGIDDWLETASSGSVIMFSARTLWMITKALRWLVRKIAIGVVGTALAVGATVLDHLAWLLHQGALASKEVAGSLVSLMGVILRFLGRAVDRAINVSVAFVRWVLGLLWSSLQNTARRALHLMPFAG